MNITVTPYTSKLSDQKGYMEETGVVGDDGVAIENRVLLRRIFPLWLYCKIIITE